MCKKIEGSCQAPVDNNLVEYICEEGFDVGKDLARKFAKVTFLNYGNE